MSIDEGILQELLDRKDISDVIHRYATGLDTCDWELFRSVFLDQIEVEFSHSYGGMAAQSMSAGEFVSASRRVIPGFDATQHIMSNFVYDIRGDTADTRVYLYAEHYLANSNGRDASSKIVGGYYNHQLRRTAAGWKIYKIKLTETWTKGPLRLFDVAAERVSNGVAPRLRGTIS